MKLEDLIGKMAVRTKALTKLEYQIDGLMRTGKYLEVPDSRWTTRPVLIKAIEHGVVYIEWKGEFVRTIYREILDPKYADDNWAPVNEKYLAGDKDEPKTL